MNNSEVFDDWGSGSPLPGAERLCRGLWLRFNRSGFAVLRLYYKADPMKDTEIWKEQEIKGCPGGEKGRLWRKEYEIDWTAGSGKRVYDVFENRQPWVIDPFPIYMDSGKDPKDMKLMEINPRGIWNIFDGLDYGRNNPTCFIWMAVAPLKEYNGIMIARKYIIREYFANDRTIAQYANEIKSKDVDWDNRPLKRNWIAIDPSTADRVKKGEPTVQEDFARNGLHTIAAPRTDAGIDIVNAWLNPREELNGEPELQVFRTCPILINEFLNYQYDDWQKRADILNPKEKPLKAFDHGMNVLKYIANLRPFPPRLQKSKLLTYKPSSEITGY